MRVLVIDTYYPALLERHYSASPSLAERSYDEQLRSLMDLGFGTSDAYSRCFEAAGVQAADVIANCEPLQRRWALEHGLRTGPRLPVGRLPGRLRRLGAIDPLGPIAAAQIEEFEPDVLYLQSLSALTTAELRRQSRRGRLVVGQIASALPAPRVVAEFDLITTSFPHFVERIKGLGVDSEYFPIAFDERVLERLRDSGVDAAPEAPRAHAVTFVGGVDPSVHGRGTDFLAELSRRAPLDVWGYGAGSLPPDSPLLPRHHGEAWGMDMYRVLADSRMAINRHIDAAEGFSNNMRLYEATGTGALLFTEQSPNLAELFEAGEEVVTYRGIDDLEDKLHHFMDDEEQRVRVAAAGQARTLAEHTYQRRIPELVAVLEARA